MIFNERETGIEINMPDNEIIFVDFKDTSDHARALLFLWEKRTRRGKARSVVIKYSVFKEVYGLNKRGLYWKIKPSHKIILGSDVARKAKAGPFKTSYDGHYYLQSRIIYCLANNVDVMPDENILHIDGDIRNDAPTNLVSSKDARLVKVLEAS